MQEAVEPQVKTGGIYSLDLVSLRVTVHWMRPLGSD
jgi:hypothetical protein